MGKYKVGDKVRVREWDDMEREFGTNQHGINSPNLIFISEMRDICGRSEIIRDIDKGGFYYLSNTYFGFSDAMLEDVEKKDKKSYKGIELINAINQGEVKPNTKFNFYLSLRYADVYTDKALNIRDSKTHVLLSLQTILKGKFVKKDGTKINYSKENINDILRGTINITDLTKENFNFDVSVKKNKTTAIVKNKLAKNTLINREIDGIGISKCRDGENFNYSTGRSIAIARAIKNWLENYEKYLIDELE